MSTPRVDRQDTPAQRSARARRAALAKNAFAPDSMATARDAKLAMFERAVDPDEQLGPDERRLRGHRLFRAWMGDVAYNASRKRRGQTFRNLNLADWLEAAQKRTAPSANGAVQEEERNAAAPASTRS